MPSAGSPDCPDCPYNTACTGLTTGGLLTRWAHREGEQWSYRRDGCPWWHYCQKCHLTKWPYDFRTRNASSRPGEAWHKPRGDVDVLVDGIATGGACGQVVLQTARPTDRPTHRPTDGPTDQPRPTDRTPNGPAYRPTDRGTLRNMGMRAIRSSIHAKLSYQMGLSQFFIGQRERERERERESERG